MFVVMKREEIQNEKLKTYPLIKARTIFGDLRANSTPIVSRPNLGHTQSHIWWVPLSSGEKLPDHETDHSRPSHAVV